MRHGHDYEITWTDALDARFAMLWESGLSSRKISERMSTETGAVMTKNAIIGRVNRLKAKGVSLTQRAPATRGPNKPLAITPKPAKLVNDPDGLPLIGQCSWPLWNDDLHPTQRLFCLAPSSGRPSWCEKHRAVGLDIRIKPQTHVVPA